MPKTNNRISSYNNNDDQPASAVQVAGYNLDRSADPEMNAGRIDSALSDGVQGLIG